MAKVKIRRKAALALAFSLASACHQAPTNRKTDLPIKSEKEACTLAIERYEAQLDLEVSNKTYCDHVIADANPPGYFVMSLHSGRTDCEGICSDNMGWFAVERKAGRVYKWNVADMQLGPPIED